MKLRNKRTGEIIEVLAKISFIKRNDNFIDSEINTFDSLTKLNEEWEDYQEPKKWYSIDMCGKVCEWDAECWAKEQKDSMKAIGNYFETREEAEKAMEKLKAWKRLKDKGFRFTGHFLGTEGLNIHYECNMNNDISDDLDLLFGGDNEISQ